MLWFFRIFKRSPMLKLPTKPNPTSTNANKNKTDDNASHGQNNQSQNNQSQNNQSQKSTIVKLENVRKTYANGAIGLRDVNIELYKGDFKFITGHSGSGKSTLLKLLYGAEQATDGEVIVNGFNLKGLKGNNLAMLRRKIGIVFQDYKLVPKRTVSENVAFVLMAQGYTYKEIQRRVQPALKMVGLMHKADCFPEELSGGEQQRTSIARAIVNTPPLVLADEPTGNLDPDNAWQVIKILKKLNSFGVTVLLTTHDEQLVRAANHPVLHLQNGYIV
nr:cell division ATP-binding protein FtsE [Pseudanabaena sp. UWO310]